MIAAVQDAVVNRKVTLSVPQLEFDWLGHQRAAWLSISDVANCGLLDCSKWHVLNLIDIGALEVIDIRSEGAMRPTYRILRDSVRAFLDGRKKIAFETALQVHLNRVSLVMGSRQASEFLRCSEFLILSHAKHFADIGAGDERRYLRIHRTALLKFIIRRRVEPSIISFHPEKQL